MLFDVFEHFLALDDSAVVCTYFRPGLSEQVEIGLPDQFGKGFPWIRNNVYFRNSPAIEVLRRILIGRVSTNEW